MVDSGRGSPTKLEVGAAWQRNLELGDGGGYLRSALDQPVQGPNRPVNAELVLALAA